MRRWIVFLCCLAAIGWMWAIFYLSALPEEGVPRAGTLFPDYINHGAAYLLLAFLLFVTLQYTWRQSSATTFGVIVGWCIVFGLGMEFAQKYLTTTRQFSLWDLLADGVGASILFLILLALQNAGNKGKKVYSLLAGNSQR